MVTSDEIDGRLPSILHLDMDAFFVAVEVLDAPNLRGLPVIVGGTGKRGVVAASSYEARAWGVYSAMPTAVARQRCPQAIFLPGRHYRYHEMSLQVHNILNQMSPLVEGIALDEAFIDVRSVRRLHGDGPTIAHELRRRISEELGLACSVGVAPRKLTAKLASEAAKPTASHEGTIFGPGVVVVTEETELAFLHAHPVGALWGVGPATKRRLEGLGVKTVSDLAEISEATLVQTLGASAGRHLHALAWARDFRPVTSGAAARSIGHEETYPNDIYERGDLDRELLRLSDAVAYRVRRAGLMGRTVQLKVRFADFHTITRSITLDEPIDDGLTLVRSVRRLLDGVDIALGVRLLGVGVSQFLDGSVSSASHQLTLGEEPAQWEEATEVIDLIRDRFGDSAIVPAALAQGGDPARRGKKNGGIRVVRRGDQQWGPVSEV